MSTANRFRTLSFPFSLPAALAMFLAFCLAALGEELGWSGYVIDPLQERWSERRTPNDCHENRELLLDCLRAWSRHDFVSAGILIGPGQNVIRDRIEDVSVLRQPPPVATRVAVFVSDYEPRKGGEDVC